MEEAETKGGGGAEKAERQTGKEEGNTRRAGEETRPTKEGRGGEIEKRRGGQEGCRGGGKEEEDGGGREEETGDDEGPEGEDGTR